MTESFLFNYFMLTGLWEKLSHEAIVCQRDEWEKVDKRSPLHKTIKEQPVSVSKIHPVNLVVISLE